MVAVHLVYALWAWWTWDLQRATARAQGRQLSVAMNAPVEVMEVLKGVLGRGGRARTCKPCTARPGIVATCPARM
jgi:hypothetical protein